MSPRRFRVTFGNARVDPRRRHLCRRALYTPTCADRWGIRLRPTHRAQTSDRPASPSRGNRAAQQTLPTRFESRCWRSTTHGYTNPAMAIAKLLGFDLCPPPAGFWPERKLYLPRGFQRSRWLGSGHRPAACPLAAIERGWDELLRLAASIRSGNGSPPRWHCSAFGVGPPRGIHCTELRSTWGRTAAKPCFLCDYIAIEDFRREIHTLLNRGRVGNTSLQRAVLLGQGGARKRGRRREEMKAISGSPRAAKRTSCWPGNTARIARGDREAQARTGSPVEGRMAAPHRARRTSRTSNFRGTMRFGVEKFSAALIQTRAGPGKLGRLPDEQTCRHPRKQQTRGSVGED